MYTFDVSDDFLAGGLGAWNIGKFDGVMMSASLNPFDVNSIVCSPALKQRSVSLDKVNHVFDKAIQDKAKDVALEIFEAVIFVLTRLITMAQLTCIIGV